MITPPITLAVVAMMSVLLIVGMDVVGRGEDTDDVCRYAAMERKEYIQQYQLVLTQG